MAIAVVFGAFGVGVGLLGLAFGGLPWWILGGLPFSLVGALGLAIELSRPRRPKGGEA